MKNWEVENEKRNSSSVGLVGHNFLGIHCLYLLGNDFRLGIMAKVVVANRSGLCRPAIILAVYDLVQNQIPETSWGKGGDTLNGTRARSIRKQVYGIEEPRKNKFYEAIKRIFRLYKKDRDGNPVLDKHGKPIEVDRITLQIRCTGKRAAYQKAKKEYERNRRGL